jgi:hypothetical protein
MDRPKLSTTIRSCQCVHNCLDFPMSVSYSLDHEIMPLPGTRRELCGHQTSHYERVIINVSLR